MSSAEFLSEEKIDSKESQTKTGGDTDFDKLEHVLKSKIPKDDKKYNKFILLQNQGYTFISEHRRYFWMGVSPFIPNHLCFLL